MSCLAGRMACTSLLFLSACQREAADDTGAAEEITCWEGGSEPSIFSADRSDEVPQACMEGLQGAWVSGDLAEDLWTWEYHLVTEPTSGYEGDQQPAAAQAAAAFGDVEAFVPTGAEGARHATAYLAAAAAADTLSSTDLERSCSLLTDYARCGLLPFLSGATCPAVPGNPPPPAGDDPEQFCGELARLVPTSGANGLVCSVTPLSTALSFIASQEGGQTSAQWLTVSSSDPGRPERVWWPAWMAAYAADAPALLMYSTTTTTGEAASGVLAVHEIGLKVSGPKTQVQRFGAYIEERLKSTTTSKPAPDWTKLTFAMPSRLVYRAWPDLNPHGPVDDLRQWVPGDRLVLPDGREADFAFTALVGVIDPCRGEEAPTGGACSNNGLAWVEVLAELEAHNQASVFLHDPSQLCPE